jgi:hypothetical protein
MLVVFLAGTTMLSAQDNQAKKIERLQRKIEKQTQKLQDLTGEERHEYQVIVPDIDKERLAEIREEARARAEEAREQARESAEAWREAMEEHREAMQEGKREMEEKMIIIRKKSAEQMEELKDLHGDKLKELKELEFDIQKDLNGKKYHYYFKSPNWKSGEDEDQDNLDIDKNLSDESGSADFTYEVKKGASKMSVNVNGSIEAGKVRILIKRPDGEVYNEYTLSPLANVNWKQTIGFEEQEESQYLGKWTVTVTAEKASGKYHVRINGR